MEHLAKVTRFEVIDHTATGQGRAFVKHYANMAVDTSFQDNERTLKIFIKETMAPIPVNRALTRMLYSYNLLKEASRETPNKELKQSIAILKAAIERELKV